MRLTRYDTGAVLTGIAALLIVLNLALAGLNAGLIGRPDRTRTERHEPRRLRDQIAADALRLRTVAAPPAPPARPAAPEPAPDASAAASDAAPLCIDLHAGNDTATARLEQGLRGLGAGSLGRHEERVSVVAWMVYLPPAANRAEGERAVANLRARGVVDLALILDNSPQRLGVSLGLFKTEAAAEARIADLGAQGVGNLRRIARNTNATRSWLRWQGPAAPARALLATLAREAPDLETRDCPQAHINGRQ